MLESSSNQNMIFVGTLNGEFVVKTDNKDENAVSRVNKVGSTVFERHYNKLEGLITDVEIYHGDYGKILNLTISDNDPKTGDFVNYKLGLPFNSNYAMGFLRRAHNIDFDKKITLFTGKYEDDKGKERTYMTVWQNGDKVAYYWTKETPRDLPDMKQVKVNGVMTWDSTDRLEYLENYVEKVIIPRVSTIDYTQTNADILDEVDETGDESLLPEVKKPVKLPLEENDDDLPF